MKQIRKMISHNQGTFVSMVVIFGLTIWTFGCKSKVNSMMDPNKRVSRDELKLEVDVMISRLETELDLITQQALLKFHDLDRQDAIKKKLFDFAAITLEGQTVNPAGLAGLAFSILGIGAVIDNRIKDKVIKNRPKAKV